MDAFGVFKAARESLWPVLTTSAFLERGVLTPEEFLKAGDHLVHTCRTWTWESGDPANVKAYLPADKQYLHIRRVASYRRVNSLTGASIKEVVVQGNAAAGGDWCSTEVAEQRNIGLGDGVMVDISDLLEGAAVDKDAAASSSSSSSSTSTAPVAAVVPSTSTPTAAPAATAKEDEYLDMEDESLALDACAVASTTGTAGSSVGAGSEGDSSNDGGDGSSIVYTRRYDVSITYDKYWQTPRIWLFGYDEAGTPLPPLSIFDDIIQDYAKKTVTIELHPHLGTPHASIHPCQHAAAMLRIIEALSGCGKVPQVEQYMFIFLKFMQSVMPTIEYDTTFDVQIGGGGSTSSGSSNNSSSKGSESGASGKR